MKGANLKKKKLNGIDFLNIFKWSVILCVSDNYYRILRSDVNFSYIQNSSFLSYKQNFTDNIHPVFSAPRTVLIPLWHIGATAGGVAWLRFWPGER